MKNLLLLFCLALLCAQSRAQTNLYVDSSVTASGAGTSWATAYKTLNEALNVVNPANTAVQYDIYVAKGTYYPTGVQSGTNRDSAFVLLRGRVRLYGGYPNGGGPRNLLNNPVVLSGNINSATDSADNSYHVLVLAGVTQPWYLPPADSVFVDGFIITKGYANGSYSKTYNGYSCSSNYGGGIFNNHVSARVQFVNLSVTGCYASGVGGGMYNYYDTGRVFGCSFTANRAGRGGAMYIDTCSPIKLDSLNFTGNTGCAVYNNVPEIRFTIDHCSFTGNTGGVHMGGALTNNSGQWWGMAVYNSSFTANSSFDGGAIYDSTAFTGVTGCSFVNNVAAHSGGAMYGAGSADKCSFTNNKAAASGGACYLTKGLRNSTFTGNRCTDTGGAAYIEASAFQCIFISDTASLGGAVFCSTCQLNESQFFNNRATRGGGFAFDGSAQTPLILNGCKFQGNMATNNGGGLFLDMAGTSCNLVNTIVSGNKAVANGGGVFLVSNGSATVLENTTVVGNDAANGAALYDSAASPIITNCIIYNGANGFVSTAASTPTVSYSFIQGGYPGVANSSADPIFAAPVAASLAPTVAGNYSLASCSPAIDAGLNTGPYTNDIDAAGQPRLYGALVDAGAYEFQGGPTAVGAITGTSTICVNSVVPLSNAAPNGAWTSNNSAVATVNSAGMVTGVSAGVATITYAYNPNTVCASSATKAITVLSGPTMPPITGDSAICHAVPLQLSNITAGGIWSSSNPGVATVDNAGAVTAATSGVDTVWYSYTNSNGCVAATFKKIIINPQPLPYIMPVSLFIMCRPGFSAMAGFPGGGTWSLVNNGNQSTIDVYDGFMHNMLPGFADVVYTYHNYYCVDTAMTSTEVAFIDTTVTVSGDTMTAVQPAAFYQWIACTNYTFIPGATNQSFVAPANGDYRVLIFLANGCGDTSACVTTHVGVANVNAVSAQFEIYPNPAKDNVTVKTTGGIPSTIRILDITGKELQTIKPTGNQTKLNLSGYVAGMYMIEVVKGNNKQTKKLSIY